MEASAGETEDAPRVRRGVHVRATRLVYESLRRVNGGESVAVAVPQMRRALGVHAMKALSLRQPWAHYVVHLGKHLENRVWNTSFRGQFLIHASKGMTKNEYAETWHWVRDRGFDSWSKIPRFGEIQRGGIIGVATLVDVVPPTAHAALARYPEGVDGRWHMREQYAFVLRDIRPTPFIPLKGSLGFFNVDDSIAAQALAWAA